MREKDEQAPTFEAHDKAQAAVYRELKLAREAYEREKARADAAERDATVLIRQVYNHHARAEAAEAAQAKLTVALRVAANALMWAGSAMNHAWAQERPPEKNHADLAYAAEEAARAALTGAASAPQAPKEEPPK